MSGVGGGSGGGGVGAGGAGNDVAQELAKVKAKIEKLENAIEEHGTGDGDWRGKLLAGLQEKENQLRGERQERERQQQQSGEHLAPLPLFPMCPLRVLLPPARCAFNWGDAMGDRGAVSSALFVPHVLIRVHGYAIGCRVAAVLRRSIQLVSSHCSATDCHRLA